MTPVLSHFQAAVLLDARKRGLPSATTSVDLGVSATEVGIHADHVVFPDSSTLGWEHVEAIYANKNACFCIQGNSPVVINGFSETLGRYFSLMPTENAPIMVMAGFPMHRSKNISPIKAAQAMIKPLLPLSGNILDTATGLGYTAIEAAKRASLVTTIELCPVALEMARMNPWSRGLFNNPKIAGILGDSFDELAAFPDECFTAVIHDPPTVGLAGDLYSGEFYKRVFRVLMPRGRMFHYLGDLGSISGARVSKGAVKRLYDEGFRNVVPIPEAFGVVAFK